MGALTDRIKKAISAEISSGAYPPGGRMPTRMQLMRKYGIARASVDKVIGQLVEEGALVSTRGSGTYVVDPSKAAPRLYLVLNTDAECAEANDFHARLSVMLAAMSGRSGHSVIGSRELESRFGEIIRNPRSRVIWSRPSIASYGDIATLARAGIRQVLVNRPIAAYNFASTDTRQALAEVFDAIGQRGGPARFGLIAPPINLEESFLAERELYFQELVHERGGQLGFMGRARGKGAGEVMRVAREAVDRVERLDYLFVPDFGMAPLVAALAAERGVTLGQDLFLITIDWVEEPQEVICIKQDWEAMLDAAVAWASAERCEPMQRLVPAKVFTPWR